MKSAPGELASRVLLDLICGARVPVNDPSGRGPLRGRIEKEAECRCYIGRVDGIADQSIQFQDVGKAPERDCEGQSGDRQTFARRIKHFSHGGRRTRKDSAVHIGQFRQHFFTWGYCSVAVREVTPGPYLDLRDSH